MSPKRLPENPSALPSLKKQKKVDIEQDSLLYLKKELKRVSGGSPVGFQLPPGLAPLLKEVVSTRDDDALVKQVVKFDWNLNSAKFEILKCLLQHWNFLDIDLIPDYLFKWSNETASFILKSSESLTDPKNRAKVLKMMLVFGRKLDGIDEKVNQDFFAILLKVLPDGFANEELSETLHLLKDWTIEGRKLLLACLQGSRDGRSGSNIAFYQTFYGYLKQLEARKLNQLSLRCAKIVQKLFMSEYEKGERAHLVRFNKRIDVLLDLEPESFAETERIINSVSLEVQSRVVSHIFNLGSARLNKLNTQAHFSLIRELLVAQIADGIEFHVDIIISISEETISYILAIIKSFDSRAELKRTFIGHAFQDAASLNAISSELHVQLISIILPEIDEILEHIQQNMKMNALNQEKINKPRLVKALLKFPKKFCIDVLALPPNSLTVPRLASIMLGFLQFEGSFKEGSLRVQEINGSFELDDKGFFLPHAQLLGLRNSKSDKAVSDFYFFNREACSDFYSDLDRHTTFVQGYNLQTVNVEGPPGCGKSSTVAAWAEHKARNCESVAWVNVFDDHFRLVVMREGLIFHHDKEFHNPADFVTIQNFCFFTVLDGLASTQTHDSVRSQCVVWASCIYPVIQVSSLQLRQNTSSGVRLKVWELEDYLLAISIDELWESVKSIFLDCTECEAAFGDRLKVPKISIELRVELVRWKFYYAGISSRFMFDCRVTVIKFLVTRKLKEANCLTIEPGERSPNALNTIYFSDDSKVHQFCSPYIIATWTETKTAHSKKDIFHMTDTFVGIKGHIYEKLLLDTIKEKSNGRYRGLNIAVQFQSSANDLLTYISLPVSGFSSFDSVEPDWSVLAPECKLQLLNKPIPEFHNFWSLCNKKLRSWKKFEESLIGKVKSTQKISAEDNISFHKLMRNSCMHSTSRIIRFMDLEGKSDHWLFPSNPTEAGFDCIYVKSEKEVWLIQITIASEHGANEEALNRAKTVFQEIFSEDTLIRFAFVTPALVKKFNIPEKLHEQFNRQDIEYLVCHSKSYWEDD